MSARTVLLCGFATCVWHHFLQLPAGSVSKVCVSPRPPSHRPPVDLALYLLWSLPDTKISVLEQISVPKSLSDASTQANRGPGTVAVRPTGTPRMRRLAGRPSAVSSSHGGARVDTTAGRGAVKVGGAVAAAAVVGAAAAAVSDFSKRRLAVSFFRWEGLLVVVMAVGVALICCR